MMNRHLSRIFLGHRPVLLHFGRQNPSAGRQNPSAAFSKPFGWKRKPFGWFAKTLRLDFLGQNAFKVP